MIPFFFFAVTDTVAVDINPETVYIHEWGVVEVDEAFATASGTRWGYLTEYGVLEPYHDYEVEAPVIWFHGAQCSGTFTVTVNNGYFTALYPSPDSLIQDEGERAAVPDDYYSQTGIWRDVNLTAYMPEMEEEILPIAMEAEGFSWAVPFWREVPANYVSVPGAAYHDRFLYYECTMNSSDEIFIAQEGCQNGYGHIGDALLFTEESGEIAAYRADVNGSLDVGTEALTDYEILGVVCGWSGSMMKSQEIKALIDTWEPAIRQRCLYEGQDVIMFPFNSGQVEAISSIRFIPDYGNPVEYTRLFLGLGAVDL